MVQGQHTAPLTFTDDRAGTQREEKNNGQHLNSLGSSVRLYAAGNSGVTERSEERSKRQREWDQWWGEGPRKEQQGKSGWEDCEERSEANNGMGRREEQRR